MWNATFPFLFWTGSLQQHTVECVGGVNIQERPELPAAVDCHLLSPPREFHSLFVLKNSGEVVTFVWMCVCACVCVLVALCMHGCESSPLPPQSSYPTPSWLVLFSPSLSWIFLLLLSFFFEQLGHHWVIWDYSSFMRFCFLARRDFCSWSLARCEGKWRAFEPSLFFARRTWRRGNRLQHSRCPWGRLSKLWWSQMKKTENASHSNQIRMSLVSLKTFFRRCRGVADASRSPW